MNLKKVILVLLLVLPCLTHPLDCKKFVTKRNALYFFMASGCALALWKLTKTVPQAPQDPVKEANDQDIDTFLRLLNINPNSQAAQQFKTDVEQRAKEAQQTSVVAVEPKTAVVPAVPVATQSISTRGASAGVQSSVDDDRNIKRGLDEAAAAKCMSDSFVCLEVPVTTQAINELEEEILRSLKSNMEFVCNIKRFNERIKYFRDNLNKLSEDIRSIWSNKLVRMQDFLNNPDFPGNKGRVLAQLVFGDPKVIKEQLDAIKKDTHRHEQVIVDLMWYFYFIAEQKDEGFSEGTFSIEDPDGALFNFICQHPGAYKRISSHYKSDKAQHYGLDIHLELPNGKHHILFGQRPNGHTFVKLESHGVKTWTDFVNHGIEYGYSLVNKFIPGADDREDMKKERVPTDIADAWKKLITGTFQNPQRAQYLAEGQKGISAMCQLLKNPDFANNFLNSDGSVEQDSKIVTFVECLSMHERSLQDSIVLSARTGREVIILRNDIK